MTFDCYLKKPLVIALAMYVAPLSPAIADEIKLTMRASSLVLEGEFQGFDGDAYLFLVDDAAGETTTLHVPAKHVICEGKDCLEFLQPDRE